MQTWIFAAVLLILCCLKNTVAQRDASCDIHPNVNGSSKNFTQHADQKTMKRNGVKENIEKYINENIRRDIFLMGRPRIQRMQAVPDTNFQIKVDPTGTLVTDVDREKKDLLRDDNHPVSSSIHSDSGAQRMLAATELDFDKTSIETNVENNLKRDNEDMKSGSQRMLASSDIDFDNAVHESILNHPSLSEKRDTASGGSSSGAQRMLATSDIDFDNAVHESILNHHPSLSEKRDTASGGSSSGAQRMLAATELNFDKTNTETNIENNLKRNNEEMYSGSQRMLASSDIDFDNTVNERISNLPSSSEKRDNVPDSPLIGQKMLAATDLNFDRTNTETNVKNNLKRDNQDFFSGSQKMLASSDIDFDDTAPGGIPNIPSSSGAQRMLAATELNFDKTNTETNIENNLKRDNEEMYSGAQRMLASSDIDFDNTVHESILNRPSSSEKRENMPGPSPVGQKMLAATDLDFDKTDIETNIEHDLKRDNDKKKKAASDSNNNTPSSSLPDLNVEHETIINNPISKESKGTVDTVNGDSQNEFQRIVETHQPFSFDKQYSWITDLQLAKRPISNTFDEFFNEWPTFLRLPQSIISKDMYHLDSNTVPIMDSLSAMGKTNKFMQLFWPFRYDVALQNQKIAVNGIKSNIDGKHVKTDFFKAFEPLQGLKIPYLESEIVLSFDHHELVNGLVNAHVFKYSDGFLADRKHLFNISEQKIITQKTNQALQLINGTNSELYRSIVQLVACLAFYKGETQKYFGGSTSNSLGIIWLDPSAVIEWPIALYAEMIVHEFIHTHLFYADLVHGIYSDHKLLSKSKVVSSIRKQLRDYDKSFHAAYVATGLATFHSRAGYLKRAEQLTGTLRSSVDALEKVNGQTGVLNKSGKAMLQFLCDYLALTRMARK